jgi:hypothetical protein
VRVAVGVEEWFEETVVELGVEGGDAHALGVSR